MTTVELERAALAIVPQAGTTGWRITTDDVAYAVVPIIGGRADGRVVFRGSQRDCTAMHHLLADGAPTSRRAQVTARPTGILTAAPASDPELVEAPAPPDGASPRLCAGCDQPLPVDANPQRLTHGGACRVAAFRRRADADGATGDVTPQRPSEADAALRSSGRFAPGAGTGRADGPDVRSAAALAGAPSSPGSGGSPGQPEPGTSLVASG